jgi:hypothetical protein
MKVGSLSRDSQIESPMAHADRESLIVSFGYPERERLEFAFAAPEISSDDWLRARSTVAVGGFHGETDLYLEASDFARLLPDLRQLYETLRGSVDFTTTENQVGFRLTGDGRGHVKLCGHLLDQAGDGNRLDFTLDYDQTLLWHSIAEIDDLLAAIGGGKDA